MIIFPQHPYYIPHTCTNIYANNVPMDQYTICRCMLKFYEKWNEKKLDIKTYAVNCGPKI